MCRRGSWSNPGETGARCSRLAPGKEDGDGVSVDRCVDRGFEESAPGFAELVGVSPFSNKDTRALTRPGERRTGGAAGPPLENREQKTENRERPTSGRRVERWEDVEGLLCGADTKTTKNHEDARRNCQCVCRSQRFTEGYTEQHREGLPVCFWKLPCRPKEPNLPRLRTPRTQRMAQGRAVRVRKAHVRPGGLREHGGLRTPRFGEGALSRHFSAPKRREEGPKARNGGRRARSAAEPQSDRWSPKRFAPPLASLRFTVWAEAKLPSL